MNKSDYQNDPQASKELTKLVARHKSNCCNAEVVEKEGYEIPEHFVCFNCFKPCEIIQEDTTNQE